MTVFTARNSSYRKVMFSQACVIPSVHRGGGPPSGVLRGSAFRWVCIQGVCLQGGWEDPPHRILMDMVNERAVRILLECILVFIYLVFKFKQYKDANCANFVYDGKTRMTR